MKRNFSKAFCNRNNYPEELFESKEFKEFNERSQNMPVQWVLDYANRIFEGVRDICPDDETPYFKRLGNSSIKHISMLQNLIKVLTMILLYWLSMMPLSRPLTSLSMR